jgi:RNA polymerase sigma factor (sigma-70 family)
MPGVEYSDAQLVANSIAGDRDAFGRIVTKYQTLLCSLAYSRLGNIGQSEDVAQDTFVVAWCHLRHLREPNKLRAWLCGILRNRIHKHLHHESQEPIHDAEPLEIAARAAAPEPLPSEESITREEEAILWRSIGKIPEVYREPLILFYREHQSVASVAAELELSEDAVKQRLSRGRKLLQEEVLVFVERALNQTAPTEAFSAMVLAALPMAAASTATAGAGAAVKGAGATKFGFLWALFAPFVGLISGLTVSWMSVHFAPNERERRAQRLTATVLWAFVLGWCSLAQPAVKAFGRHHHWSDHTWVGVMAGFWWLYAAVATLIIVLHFRRILAIRGQLEASGSVTAKLTLTGRQRLVYVAGFYLAMFSWLIYLAWDTGDRLWAWIIAAIMIALFAWRLYQGRGKTGAAAMRMVGGHFVLAFVVVLVVLNLRLGAWVAERRDVSVAEVHQFLPIWLVPMLSVALIAWVAALIAVTKPSPKPNSHR